MTWALYRCQSGWLWCLAIFILILPKPCLTRQDLRSFPRDLYIKPAAGELLALQSFAGAFSLPLALLWLNLGGCLNLHHRGNTCGSFIPWVSVFEGMFFWCTEEPESDLLRINSPYLFWKSFFFLNQFRNWDFFFLLVDQSLNLSRDGKMEHVYVAAPTGRVGYSSCRK